MIQMLRGFGVLFCGPSSAFLARAGSMLLAWHASENLLHPHDYARYLMTRLHLLHHI